MGGSDDPGFTVVTDSPTSYYSRPVLTTREAIIYTAVPTWESELLAKIGELRASGKRAILVIDGKMIFVFRAENAGTIRMTE